MLEAALEQPVERIDELEDSYRQYEATDEAVLTGIDNKIVFSNIVSRVKVEKGDVVRIVASAIGYDKLHTIESIVNQNEVHVNWEHCGARGNGILKLPDYTGPVTVKRIAKWFTAAEGLGQDWVGISSIRPANVSYTNPTNRTIAIAVTAKDAGTGSSPQLSINGVRVGAVNASSTSTEFDAEMYGSVPIDGSYIVSFTGAQSSQISFSERR